MDLRRSTGPHLGSRPLLRMRRGCIRPGSHLLSLQFAVYLLAVHDQPGR